MTASSWVVTNTSASVLNTFFPLKELKWRCNQLHAYLTLFLLRNILHANLLQSF